MQRQGTDISPTVTIVNRISSILADIILIVITWKLIPDSSIINHKGHSETTKTKGLASIMLYNGTSISFRSISLLRFLQF